MKTGFPHTILGFPIGWKKRGNVGQTYNHETESYHYSCCNICKTKAKIGIQNSKSFLYCCKCLCTLVK